MYVLVTFYVLCICLLWEAVFVVIGDHEGSKDDIRQDMGRSYVDAMFMYYV